MKIIGVKVLEFRRRLDGRSWNPAFRWHERRAPLLILETDSGLSGVGEAGRRREADPEIAALVRALLDQRKPIGANTTADARFSAFMRRR